jgi:hypothetical protein
MKMRKCSKGSRKMKVKGEDEKSEEGEREVPVVWGEVWCRKVIGTRDIHIFGIFACLQS